jgi:hypothetical protein
MASRHDTSNNGSFSEQFEPPLPRTRRREDGRINTPPPIELNKAATVGYVYAALSEHHDGCSQQQADARRPLWGKLIELETTMGKILGGIKLLAILVPIIVTVALGVMVPLVKWAVKGVVAEEIDKKIPPALIDKLAKDSTTVQTVPWGVAQPSSSQPPTFTANIQSR